jgi:hypothetical protein
LVALAYRYRWSVELFFRWLKCVRGARHLIAQKGRGNLDGLDGRQGSGLSTAGP